MSQRRGMTLVELLIVVAIISAISAMSVLSLREFAVVGRVNRGAKILATAMTGARLKAVSTRCAHLVVIHGRTWAGMITGVPELPGRPADRNTIFVVRKREQSCGAGAGGAGQPYFEAGDRILERYPLGPDENPRGVRLRSPTAVWGGNVLDAQSLIVAYDANGARWVSVHPGSGADYAIVPQADFDLIVEEPLPTTVAAGQKTRAVNVTASGNPMVRP